MKKQLLLILLFPFSLLAQDFTTLYEKSNATKTPDYHEIINWWTALDSTFKNIKLLTMGESDAGYPIHLALISSEGDFSIPSIKTKNKRIILVNNGIHPGEPDGIDASMLLARDILQLKKKLPANVVLAFIPVYNIGGCLNRSPNYRVDQNGPELFGFRGNGQNLDLNRDFIKSDSKNARAFAQIFHYLDPDVFIDNHVSNGADYQHIMTLLTSQHNRLGGQAGEYLNSVFEPGIYSSMQKKGYDLIPYYNVYGSLDNGWVQYFDGPRYSSGYASLWGTFAFVPETHMLKPYAQRVQSTYALMESFIEFVGINSEKIGMLRQKAKQESITQTSFPLTWQVNRSKSTSITFKGYTSGTKASEVSGLPRLYYDRTKPFEQKVTFYNYFTPGLEVKKPAAFIIPQGWWQVMDLLKLNKIYYRQLSQDSMINVDVFHIADYETASRPYEMHYLHSNVKVTESSENIQFRKGDYYIPLNQPGNRFLMEVLDPRAPDSYFNWNFFDGILGQKEGFSAYNFEDIAARYLKENPELQQQIKEKRATDTSFAKSARAQLDFVFKNSPYFEPDFLRYPVYRVPIK